jgi:hypothetical protein
LRKEDANSLKSSAKETLPQKLSSSRKDRKNYKKEAAVELGQEE